MDKNIFKNVRKWFFSFGISSKIISRTKYEKIKGGPSRHGSESVVK